MVDGIGAGTVIGERVVGDRPIRLGSVCGGSSGTHSRSFVDVGMVRV